MGATIYDIAAQAGVSIATVSRVLNGSPRVSVTTRSRVRAVADALSYQPHVSAQNLARQKSHLIAAVIPVVTNYFYMEIMRGMQDALLDTDFDLLVYAAPSPAEIDGQLGRAAQKGRADGVILFSKPLTDGQAVHLRRSSLPVVMVDAAHPEFDSICVDNVTGGYLATRHLLEQGCERIAFSTLVPEPPPAAQRRAGYEHALQEAGRRAERALVASGDHRRYGFDEEAGYVSMQGLLGRPSRPDGVFVASDVQALGVLRALEEAGLRVPDDVAVVGFDDVRLSEHVGLTTLRQPMAEMGRLAVERVLTRIQDPDGPPVQMVFAPRLIVRRTSRPGGRACPAKGEEGKRQEEGERREGKETDR